MLSEVIILEHLLYDQLGDKVQNLNWDHIDKTSWSLQDEGFVMPDTNLIYAERMAALRAKKNEDGIDGS